MIDQTKLTRQVMASFSLKSENFLSKLTKKYMKLWCYGGASIFAALKIFTLIANNSNVDHVVNTMAIILGCIVVAIGWFYCLIHAHAGTEIESLAKEYSTDTVTVQAEIYKILN